MNKALLKVGYTCNSSCVFCHARPHRNRHELATDELRRRVAQARDAGARMVVFSGGEPTIRKDIEELAEFASRIGLCTGVITNGRRFVYPDFGERLSARGLRYAYVSFHSHRAEVHAATTRTDSFAETKRALANLSKLPVELSINVVVTAYNLQDLDGVVDLAASFEPARLKLSVVEPKGAALDVPSVIPPLRESAAAIRAAIRRGRSRHPRLRFACEGLTPCLLPGFDGLNDDLLAQGFTLFREAYEDRFATPDRRNRGHGRACRTCARRQDCPGVYESYLDGPGILELSPLR